MSDTDPERASHVAGAAPGRQAEGVPERAENRVGRDGEERQAEARDRRVFTGQEARGPVADRGTCPPAPVDCLAHRHRLDPVVRKDLVQAERQELRRPGRLPAARHKPAEITVLGDGQRIVESEGHPHRRQGVVVPRRIADEHPARRSIGDPRLQFVGRRLEVAAPQGVDEGRAHRVRQQLGVGFRQHGDPVPGSPVVQWDIDDDAHALRSQIEHEDGARSTENHMAVSLVRETDAFGNQPDHARAGCALRRKPERAAHDGSAAVRADHPFRRHRLLRPVDRERKPPVFDRAHPPAAIEVHAGFVFERRVQFADERRMFIGKAPGSVGIGQQDRLRTVFRKHREAVADAAVRTAVKGNAEVLELAHGERVQPLAGQSMGRPGVGFEEGDPGALARMGERAQAADRARTHHRNVVTGRSAHRQRQTPGWGRRL